MKIAVTICTYLLGLVFVVFGLNHWFHFIPMDMSAMSDQTKTFMGTMMDSGYMTVVKVLEVVGGAMLLANFKRAAGLVILAPIVVNILLTELCIMNQPGIGVALTAITAFLVYANKDKFEAIWK